MRVLVSVSNANDGCSWYRGADPWARLAKMSGIDILYAPRPDRIQMRSCDAVFFLRPCTKENADAIELAVRLGIPVWSDYDDDLMNLPADNPSYSYFSNPAVMQQLIRCVRASTLITTSTSFLKRQMSPMNENIKILPNAFDLSIGWKQEGKEQNDIVLWRGTATHTRDVAEVADQIVAASERFPKTTFAFLGSDPAPWACSERIKNVQRFPSGELLTYFDMLKVLRPKIVITPLSDHAFNRSKSNIGALEAFYAGAASIAPKWEEWSIPGVINYESRGDFGKVLMEAMENPEKVKTKAKEGWDFIADAMNLDMVNNVRLAILKELCA